MLLAIISLLGGLEFLPERRVSQVQHRVADPRTDKEALQRAWHRLQSVSTMYVILPISDIYLGVCTPVVLCSLSVIVWSQ